MLEKRAKEIGAAKRRKTVMGAFSKAYMGHPAGNVMGLCI
jgi:hypothetical protein